MIYFKMHYFAHISRERNFSNSMFHFVEILHLKSFYKKETWVSFKSMIKINCYSVVIFLGLKCREQGQEVVSKGFIVSVVIFGVYSGVEDLVCRQGRQAVLSGASMEELRRAGEQEADHNSTGGCCMSQQRQVQ